MFFPKWKLRELKEQRLKIQETGSSSGSGFCGEKIQ